MSDADARIVENERGGRQSELPVRLDLLSPTAMYALGQVLSYGAGRYEPWNWRKIDRNDHLNHAMYHILRALEGNETERFNNTWHAFCRLMFAVDVEASDDTSG